MALGPGKYDDLCTEAREKAGAAGAALILWGGPGGDGFSVQGEPMDVFDLPDLLRQMADTIEHDIKDDVIENCTKEIREATSANKGNGRGIRKTDSP